ncbi:MAG: hypothetical protein IPJ88_01545 [Myxococcales bacterium]|nr:MAG: hypothetical protein IPJ88_01545 [Myxococcales bacterium]
MSLYSFAPFNRHQQWWLGLLPALLFACSMGSEPGLGSDASKQNLPSIGDVRAQCAAEAQAAYDECTNSCAGLADQHRTDFYVKTKWFVGESGTRWADGDPKTDPWQELVEANKDHNIIAAFIDFDLNGLQSESAQEKADAVVQARIDRDSWPAFEPEVLSTMDVNHFAATNRLYALFLDKDGTFNTNWLNDCSDLSGTGMYNSGGLRSLCQELYYSEGVSEILDQIHDQGKIDRLEQNCLANRGTALGTFLGGDNPEGSCSAIQEQSENECWHRECPINEQGESSCTQEVRVYSDAHVNFYEPFCDYNEVSAFPLEIHTELDERPMEYRVQAVLENTAGETHTVTFVSTRDYQGGDGLYRTSVQLNPGERLRDATVFAVIDSVWEAMHVEDEGNLDLAEGNVHHIDAQLLRLQRDADDLKADSNCKPVYQVQMRDGWLVRDPELPEGWDRVNHFNTGSKGANSCTAPLIERQVIRIENKRKATRPVMLAYHVDENQDTVNTWSDAVFSVPPDNGDGKNVYTIFSDFGAEASFIQTAIAQKGVSDIHEISVLVPDDTPGMNSDVFGFGNFEVDHIWTESRCVEAAMVRGE